MTIEVFIQGVLFFFIVMFHVPIFCKLHNVSALPFRFASPLNVKAAHSLAWEKETLVNEGFVFTKRRYFIRYPLCILHKYPLYLLLHSFWSFYAMEFANLPPFFFLGGGYWGKRMETWNPAQHIFFLLVYINGPCLLPFFFFFWGGGYGGKRLETWNPAQLIFFLLVYIKGPCVLPFFFFFFELL